MDFLASISMGLGIGVVRGYEIYSTFSHLPVSIAWGSFNALAYSYIIYKSLHFVKFTIIYFKKEGFTAFLMKYFSAPHNFSLYQTNRSIDTYRYQPLRPSYITYRNIGGFCYPIYNFVP